MCVMIVLVLFTSKLYLYLRIGKFRVAMSLCLEKGGLLLFGGDHRVF